MSPGASLSHRLAVFVSPDRLRALGEAGASGVNLAGAAKDLSTADLPGDIVIVEDGEAGAGPLLEAYALRRPDAAMLVIGDDLSVPLVRALFRFTASDVLPAGCTATEILNAVGALASKVSVEEVSDTSPEGATCWAFRGAVGGAGVTTLAIETAFALVQSPAGSRVCLVDFNLADAMTPAFLDGEAKLDLPAICANPERIDPTLLRVYTWEHAKGVHLIAAPRQGDADARANCDALLRLLDVACSSFDHVIVDLPRHKCAWTDPIQSAADEMVIVSELTVPSLHAAADLCRDIDKLRDRPCRLALNRMFAKRRHRHSFPVDKAERAIHRKIDHTIRSDWDSARAAVNLGMPIAQVKSKSPIVSDVSAMVEALLAGEVPQATEEAA